MRHQALRQHRITPLTRIAEAYIPALFGDGGSVLASLVGPTGRIEDHKFGRLEGPRNAARLPERFRSWLSGWKIQELVHLRTLDAGNRAVSEDIVFATAPDGRKIEWPFATLAKPSVDGRSHEFFVYYTIWPIIERHTKRPVIFDTPELDTEPSDLLRTYHKCLTTGDMNGLYTVFAQDAYVREPSGPPWSHLGMTQILNYFCTLFRDGAPLMRTERITANDRCLFLEFAVIGWNDRAWPSADHQAGAGMWELNADGKLIAVRVYDDVQF